MILPYKPTKYIPNKLYSPKVIIPVLNDDEDAKHTEICQKDIKFKELRGPLKYDTVPIDLKLTEFRQEGNSYPGGLLGSTVNVIHTVRLIKQLLVLCHFINIDLKQVRP